MAIRIRCTGCQKKISIDEAFAGGVCRCPYCSELVVVGALRQPQVIDRPEEPGRPDEPPGPSEPVLPPESPAGPPAKPLKQSGRRPETPLEVPSPRRAVQPAAPAAPAPTAVTPPQHVPVARPVKLQGVLSIILIIGFLAAVGVMTVIVYLLLTKSNASLPSGRSPAPTGVKPSNAPGPSVAGAEIKPPVVYVLDGGSSMRENFSYAAKMVRVSIRTLQAGKFNVLLLTEGEIRQASTDYATGLTGQAPAKDFLSQPFLPGATNLEKGLSQALDLKPATIVLFAAKGMEAGAIERLSTRARKQSTTITCIILSNVESVTEDLTKLADLSGGVAKTFSSAQLDDWNSAVGDE